MSRKGYRRDEDTGLTAQGCAEQSINEELHHAETQRTQKQIFMVRVNPPSSPRVEDFSEIGKVSCPWIRQVNMQVGSLIGP